MKLYCVRHGEAAAHEVDHVRPLTPQGVNDVTGLAEYLSQHGVTVDHIMHSSKLRAAQTATILASVFPQAKVSSCDTLLAEQGDIEPMLAVIKALGEDTLLVGHLPFMVKLVNALVLGDPRFYPIVKFSPGTVVCLEHSADHRWVINWLLNPAIIEAKV